MVLTALLVGPDTGRAAVAGVVGACMVVGAEQRVGAGGVDGVGEVKLPSSASRAAKLAGNQPRNFPRRSRWQFRQCDGPRIPCPAVAFVK